MNLIKITKDDVDLKAYKGQTNVRRSIQPLRYGKVVVATDMDTHGNHILALVLNLFNELWPDVLVNGMINKLTTPIMQSTYKGKAYEFFTKDEYDEWADGKSGMNTRFLKGLGSNNSKDFKKYISDDAYITPIYLKDDDDTMALDIAFSKNMANRRKEFIYESV